MSGPLPDLSALHGPINNASVTGVPWSNMTLDERFDAFDRIYREEAERLRSQGHVVNESWNLNYADEVHSVVYYLLELRDERSDETHFDFGLEGSLREDEDLMQSILGAWAIAVAQKGVVAYTYPGFVLKLREWERTLAKGTDGMHTASSVPEARDAVRNVLQLLISIPYLSTPPPAPPHA